MLPRSHVPSSADAAGDGRSGVVDCALYVDGARQPGQWSHADALARARERDNAFVWIGLHEPSPAEFADIAVTFRLHELAVEDAIKAFQRPKLERYEQVTFAVLRTARYLEHRELTESTDVVETGNVMLFLGPQFVISVRHGDACRLAPVRSDLEARSHLLAQGPWAVFHAVCDRVVDIYLAVAASIEEDVNQLEDRVFSREGGADIQRIYQLKRELVEFKRAVYPLQRPLTALVGGQVPGVPKEVRRYIRDVADHLSRVIEQLSTFDDLLNSILQARLAQVTVDQNNDMRKIAAWAAIAAVQTGIAGVYGMNFSHMPELQWKYGYPLVIGLMALCAVVLYRLFRRSGWL
ncbi:MAG TPA: magnesium/cobalt transporter CorA [Micromonosporaceae bacterium]